MPTYDYACEKCGGIEEHFHGITEEPEFTCGVCGGAMKRLLSAGAGVIFKGTGFYETDYKKSGSAGTASRETSSTESSSSSAPEKSDSSSSDKPSTADTGKGSGKSEKKAEKK